MTGEELHVLYLLFSQSVFILDHALSSTCSHLVSPSKTESQKNSISYYPFSSLVTPNYWLNGLGGPLVSRLPRGEWNCLGGAITLDGCSACVYWGLLSKASAPSQNRGFLVHKNEMVLTPLELGIKLSFWSSLSGQSVTTSENHRKHCLRSYLEKRILVIDSYIWSSINDSIATLLPTVFCCLLLNCIWISNISLHLTVFIKHLFLLPQYHYCLPKSSNT